MHGKLTKRLEALEKAAMPAQNTCRQVQVVIYNAATGQPLNVPDGHAIKQIWMADDGSGLELANAR